MERHESRPEKSENADRSSAANERRATALPTRDAVEKRGAASTSRGRGRRERRVVPSTEEAANESASPKTERRLPRSERVRKKVTDLELSLFGEREAKRMERRREKEEARERRERENCSLRETESQ